MTTLEHKKYGAGASEFIIHHRTIRPCRLLYTFLVTSSLAFVFKLNEIDIMALWILSALLAIILIFRLLNKVTKEILLVLPSVGVQVKTQYWFGHQETQFFDKTHVKGIVILEAITLQSILCYLAILLIPSQAEKLEQVVPLFTRSWPSMANLVYMYQELESMNCDYSNKSVSLQEQCTSIETKSHKVGSTCSAPEDTKTPSSTPPASNRVRLRSKVTVPYLNSIRQKT